MYVEGLRSFVIMQSSSILPQISSHALFLFNIVISQIFTTAPIIREQYPESSPKLIFFDFEGASCCDMLAD
jgi:hypothetical protein